MDQFFGRTTWRSLGILGALLGLAVLGFVTELDLILLAIVGIITLVETSRKLEWGIYIAFLELFSNPHGIMLQAEVAGQNLSLRMAIFGAVMLGWGIHAFTHRRELHIDWKKLSWFVPLLLAIVIGWGVGISTRSFGEVFSDGNAYLYLLYLLPMLSVQWSQKTKRHLLQVLTAAGIWVSLISFALLFAFTHLHTGILSVLYSFFRDLRIAEITALDEGVYRIFIQSQLFVILGGMFLAALPKHENKKQNILLAAFVYAIVLMGMSRSFWVGIIPAVAVIGVFLLKTRKPSLKQVGEYLGWNVLAAVAGAVLLIGLTVIPVPGLQDIGGDIVGSFKERTTESNDAGISSRWNLLTPIVEGIKDQPILGHGFGKSVTYITDDPRAREINPDGTWTVVAMEWGWLELWLKMGIMGVLGFLYLGYQLAKEFWMQVSADDGWISITFIAAGVFLFATHTFSPYLNHPMGLGLLLFMLPFIHNKKQAEQVSTVSKSAKNVPLKTVAVVTSEST
jgi:hypothetical protein